MIRGLQYKNAAGFPTGEESKFFTGPFPIESYDPAHPDELTFTIPQATTENPADLDYSWAFIGLIHQALSCDGGTATVAEANRVFHCQMGGPYHDTGSTLDLRAVKNYYHDVLAGPTQLLTQISSTSDLVPLQSLDYDDSVEICNFLALDSFQIYDNSRAVATTSRPHGFGLGSAPDVPNDSVSIGGADGPDAALYTGTFQIAAVPTATEFEFDLYGTVTTGSSAGYRTIDSAPLFKWITSQRPLAALTSELVDGKYVATAESSYNNQAYWSHGLKAGDVVWIGKAGRFEQTRTLPNSSLYNGPCKVWALGSGPTGANPNTKFRFILPGDPGSAGADFCPGYFGRMWQIRHYTVDSNVIELTVRKLRENGYIQIAVGIFILGGELVLTRGATTVRERRFPVLLVRRNIIRHVENLSDPSLKPRPIWIYSTENGLIEKNIVGMDPQQQPIECVGCGTISTFKNQTPSGERLPAVEAFPETGTVADRELLIEAVLEDAVLASVLQ